ncbi:hypothetical protein [Lihuaxuella thermophila]|uniref:Uncharacterized protein n=1 Tax=Lihuaxuella thermophila TaxID=1173111 RepID=A0A1H8G743_9BACL|nr:hypothetical protein [Lihuaxuella thermophila]SEN39951.1 hypothetical protein SAMN05444955_110127 [Lihuaxuella thermophila]
MLAMLVKGQANRVQAFLTDLQQRPQMKLVHTEVSEQTGDRIKVFCYIQHQPKHRMCVVQLAAENGETIRIPLVDAIRVEMEEGKTLWVGKVVDLFA